MNTELITDKEITTDKIELSKLANKLFMYCDAQQWQRMVDEVFTPTIQFDMSSAGGGAPTMMEAKAVCEIWRQGFVGLDTVHHQAGHYLITVRNDEADIFGYAVAFHYKKAATKGHTRSFVGSYDLKAIRTSDGWRLSQFKYNLTFIDGNITLE
jgi:SnoaL-like domain